MGAIKRGADRKKKRHIHIGPSDMSFAIVVLILLGIGIVMMFSASYAIAINEGKSGYFYALRQSVFALIGIAMMTVMSFVDYHIFKKYWVALSAYVGAVLLLVLVLFIGTDLGTGCKRWLDLKVTTFQPSELAKFAVIISFSYLIDKNFDKMKKFKTGIVPFVLLLVVVVLLLMKEPHLSCTLLICVIAIMLMFVGGTKWWHLLLTGVTGAVGLVGVVLWKIYREGVGYFLVRLSTWQDPFSSADAWQTRQSLIAIGSGGLLGLGLGESRQKYLYLPESENDFVFAVVCEELGLVGAIMVILLFVLLVIQGFRIAMQCRDRFGMLISLGFSLQIGLQAFLNIAVVSNLVPNTGISLPFFSYGGTALIMQLMQMGIVMNVSRRRFIEPESTEIGDLPRPEPVFRQDA